MPRKHKKREALQEREDLIGEHAVGDTGQIILACLFAATWIADTFFFQLTTFLNPYVPLRMRIALGIVVLMLSYYLAKTGLSIVFGEKREKPVRVPPETGSKNLSFVRTFIFAFPSVGFPQPKSIHTIPIF